MPDHDRRAEADLERRSALAEVHARMFGRALPVTLDRYRVLSCLGRGAMGAVYAAHDPKLERRVAVKVLRSEVLDAGDAGARERLLREARALARLTHPNVVAIHDVGMLPDGQVWLAMDLVEGEALDRWLASARRSTAEILEVMRQAARGLAAAHAVGLVHRDFKPSNVLVGAAELGAARVRVVDFGVARFVGETSASDDPEASVEHGGLGLTAPGAQPGTPRYMAPEQHRGEPADARADQFAFCVVLFEALYDRRPFADAELAEAKAHGRWEIPRGARRVPRHVVGVLRRGLAGRPEDRHRDLREVERALGRRRSWVGPAALVGIALASIAALPRSAVEVPADACADPSAQLRGVWDASAREGLRLRIVADVHGGAQAWPELERTLDDYAQAWSGAWADDCRASTDRAAGVGGRATCLARLRSEMGALVTAVQEREGSVWADAIAGARDLLPADECVVERTPSDDRERAFVEERLSTAKARLATSAPDRALEASTVALGSAERLGDGSVLARAWLVHGRTLSATGRTDEALAAFGRAITGAMEHDDERTEAHGRVAAMRLRLVQGSVDAAEILAPETEAAVRRVHEPRLSTVWGVTQSELLQRRGDMEGALAALESAVASGAELGPDDIDHGEAVVARASTLAAAGRLDEAIAAFPEAIAMVERRLGADHPRVASARYGFGTALFEAGRPDEALPQHRTALEIRRRTLAPDHMFVVDALMAVAGDRFTLGDASGALVDAEAAVAMLEKLHPPPHTDVARAWIDLSLLREAVGQREGAIELLGRARDDYARLYAVDDPRRAEPEHALGSVLVSAGRFAEAEAPLRTALVLLERGDAANLPAADDVRALLAAVAAER